MSHYAIYTWYGFLAIFNRIILKLRYIESLGTYVTQKNTYLHMLAWLSDIESREILQWDHDTGGGDSMCAYVLTALSII